MFRGFPPEAITFLRGLSRNNRREWFQPRKHIYETKVKAAVAELVAALTFELRKFAPGYLNDPKKPIYRIYRDTRFSTDKTPYKTHIAARFPRRGLDTTAPSVFYISVSADEIGVGGGIYHPDPQSILTIRTYIPDHHREIRRVLEKRSLKQALGELQGDELRRLPKGFDPAHPAADLIRKKDWFLYASLDAKLALGPELFKELRSRFRLILPVLEALAKPFPAGKGVKAPDRK